MPKGPQGQKRKADVIGNAILVAKIATGEVEDIGAEKPNRAAIASKGGAARAAKLSPARRSEIAKAGARARKDRAARAEEEGS